MLPSISESPESLDYSEWTYLLQQLPLFPPAAHPPPTLFPLLSPILQQKLGFLSLGRGSGWPGALTWLEPALSYKVNERLKSSNRQAGLQERFKGYRRFDQEMILANVALQQPKLELWFSWIPHQDGHFQTGWKLHDIRLSEVDTDMNWYESIEEATLRYNQPNGTMAADNGDDYGESDEDDSYWNQYDQFTASATTPGLESESFDTRTEITPRLEDPSSYYDQYDNVETAISSSGAGARDFAQPAETANGSVASSGIDGSTENGLPDDIGMEDYIRNAVRNLSQLALRSGMSEKRLRDLITEGMN